MEYISQGKQIHRTITDNSALASVDNIVTLPGRFLLVVCRKVLLLHEEH